MTGPELEAAAADLYGHAWRHKLAAAMGVNLTTVYRWISGRVPVPVPVAVAIRCLLANRDRSKREDT